MIKVSEMLKSCEFEGLVASISDNPEFKLHAAIVRDFYQAIKDNPDMSVAEFTATYTKSIATMLSIGLYTAGCSLDSKGLIAITAMTIRAFQDELISSTHAFAEKYHRDV